MSPCKRTTRRRQDAYDFLYRRIDYERLVDVPYRAEQFKLERMHDLMARLGDPHHQLKIIHVAGTKGKGSTAAMIGAMLTAQGYRVGVYSSPHLFQVEERAAIDGRSCHPDDWVELVDAVRPHVDELDGAAYGRAPTFFEIVTAISLLYFARQRVDFAVLEVGLGGRLDSTNVCQPCVSVITSISFDHTRQLGNSLSQIAREKAGIIKRGVDVVSGVLAAEPRDVIAAVAAQHDCRLYQADRDFGHQYQVQPRIHSPALHIQNSLTYWQRTGDRTCELEDLQLALPGRHQAANAAVALATVGRIKAQGWILSETSMRTGLAAARCRARIEVVGSQPSIVVDVAHNVASVEALVETLLERFGPRKRRLLFATSVDKDAGAMLDRLLPHFEQIMLTQYSTNPRSLSADRLMEIARHRVAGNHHPDHHQPHAVAELHCNADPVKAWRQLLAETSANELICLAGSSFIASELYDVVQQSGNQLARSGA